MNKILFNQLDNVS